MKCSKHLYFILISLLVLASFAFANEAEDEEYKYWLKRETEASKIAQASYVADPFSVTDSFNKEVDGTPSIKKATSSPSVQSGSGKTSSNDDEV